MASLVIVFSTVLVLSRGHTHTDIQSDADERITPATLVGVSNYGNEWLDKIYLPVLDQTSSLS